MDEYNKFIEKMQAIEYKKQSGSLYNDQKELQMLRSIRQKQAEHIKIKQKEKFMKQVEKDYIEQFQPLQKEWVQKPVRKDKKKTQEDKLFLEKRQNYDEYDKFLLKKFDQKLKKEHETASSKIFNVPQEYQQELKRFMDPLYRLEGSKSYKERNQSQTNQFKSLNSYLGLKDQSITQQDKKILNLINEKVQTVDKLKLRK